jgi:hypothetical protein
MLARCHEIGRVARAMAVNRNRIHTEQYRGFAIESANVRPHRQCFSDARGKPRSGRPEVQCLDAWLYPPSEFSGRQNDLRVRKARRERFVSEQSVDVVPMQVSEKDRPD